MDKKSVKRFGGFKNPPYLCNVKIIHPMKKTKLTKRDLLLKLIGLQDEIRSKINYLNHGGCGTFSKMFYEEVIKFYPKEKVRIVALDKDEPITYKKSIMKYYLNDVGIYPLYDINSITPSHLMIEIDKSLLIDGYGVLEKKKGKYNSGAKYKGYLTLDELSFCLEYGSWNDMYDTKQNKKLQKIIQKYFTEEKLKINL